MSSAAGQTKCPPSSAASNCLIGVVVTVCGVVRVLVVSLDVDGHRLRHGVGLGHGHLDGNMHGIGHGLGNGHGDGVVNRDLDGIVDGVRDRLLNRHWHVLDDLQDKI
jgi:hypothetical protein